MHKEYTDNNIYTFLKSSLIAHLEKLHSQLVRDRAFICIRSDRAAQCYEKKIDKGIDIDEAYQDALCILFHNLQFSKSAILKDIYLKKYGAEDEEHLYCLMEQCESIFQKYDLTDDFKEKPEYMELYSDLEEEVSSI
ncbi:DUF1896 family protein [Dysgonomonas sp. 521]|uniref:DUF1896 family protein n=1 Tax=Dysgonomonas sp. 521 TaxID=2302932 RepID=UPI0013D62E9A|nr:DUF1896 family protein [Dysgonomonas sp. 521]NDV95021.1 DUF1896 family protein [Dysgonomonas sp. 521]